MEGNRENPVRRAYRRYFVEMGLVMVLYFGMMLVRYWLLVKSGMHLGKWWQVGAALLPAVPMVWMLLVIIGLVRRTDELQRKILIESAAIAGAATALLGATYGFIEGDYFPRLSAWWTYGAFMFVWLIASLFVRRSYRCGID